MNLVLFSPIPIAAFVISSILLFIYFKLKIGIQDIPNERSMHKTPVKKAGGMVFISILILFWLFTNKQSPNYLFLIAGLLFTFTIGILDDLLNPGSKTKLVAEFIFFIPFSYLINPNILIFWIATSGIFSAVLLSLYIVFIVNLVNFMDGMDLYLIAHTFTVLLIAPFAVPNLDLNSIQYGSLLAVLLAFAIFNKPPAKMFMGDSGSLPIGFMIAMLPLLSTDQPKEPTTIFFLIPVFLVDGILTILKRAWKGENILKAHRQHLYQEITTILSPLQTLMLFSLANLVGIPFLYYNFRKTGIVTILVGFSVIYFFMQKKINAPRGTRTPTLSSED